MRRINISLPFFSKALAIFIVLINVRSVSVGASTSEDGIMDEIWKRNDSVEWKFNDNAVTIEHRFGRRVLVQTDSRIICVLENLEEIKDSVSNRTGDRFLLLSMTRRGDAHSEVGLDYYRLILLTRMHKKLIKARTLLPWNLPFMQNEEKWIARLYSLTDDGSSALVTIAFTSLDKTGRASKVTYRKVRISFDPPKILNLTDDGK